MNDLRTECFVYTLTNFNGTTDFGINTYPPPYCEPIDSLPAGFEVHTIPLNGIEWANARSDREAIEHNVHVWELIVKSLVKRHKRADYGQVALVSMFNHLQAILEARRLFLERTTFTDKDGKVDPELTKDMNNLCRLHVPVTRLGSGIDGNERSWFVRWSII